MNYQTFPPHPDLEPFVKCFWILEVPAAPNVEKQRIVPDGCIEMFFILGDDVKRYTSENESIIQPKAMVLGQITEPMFIKPTGEVKTFAVRFYPYGFSTFVKRPISELANKETLISELFEQKQAEELERKVVNALNTEERIAITQKFLLDRLKDQQTIDGIVQSTVDSLLQTKGSVPINELLKDDLSKRRTLERKFSNQVGISPKQLGKIVRIQTALKMLLEDEPESLTKIAYESEYYDQAHFIKDFKEFTGINPKEFLSDEQMALSSVFYTEK